MDLIDSGSHYIYVILIIVVLICSFNISIDGVDVSDTMLPTADNNGFVIVKLKKRCITKAMFTLNLQDQILFCCSVISRYI